jgi:hypothetical protein
MGKSASKRGCNQRPWEFLKSNHSLIPTGGDTCTALYYNAAQGTDALTARFNVRTCAWFLRHSMPERKR